MVGITGGDGSGKSTALAALGGWLEPEFDVRLVHLGKPRWSATTFGVRAGLKAVTAGAEDSRGRFDPPIERLASAVETYRPLFWLVCTARDGQNAYRRAPVRLRRRARTLRPLSTSSAQVDGGPVDREQDRDGPDNRFVRALIALEERYHRSIASPELLVVLRVDPEIAVQRKTEERPETVRARGAEVWNIDWRGSRARRPTRASPRIAVARELKALVWSVLA